MKNIQEVMLSTLNTMSKYKDINSDDYRCIYHPLEEQRWDNYSDFLDSRQWKEKKIRVLSYWGDRCIKCKKKYNHIHHLNYMELWGGEHIKRDLLPLCSLCHKREHIKFRQSEIIAIKVLDKTFTVWINEENYDGNNTDDDKKTYHPYKCNDKQVELRFIDDKDCEVW